MSESNPFATFDALLDLKGPVIICSQQKLKVASISSDDIVFPPSYAPTAKKRDTDDKNAKKDKEIEKDSVYNIDILDPENLAKNVCVLDSIPSQANRIEPIFATDDYKALVPQFKVKLIDDVDPISILAIGHRLADAVFRGTTLRMEIVDAFKQYAKGNATGIARLGPTSLVFGVWDSRGTGVKIPRLINSIVRAFGVIPLRRSAQYTPPIKYKQEGLLPPGLDIDPAEYGLADVPSPLKIGGVQVNGEIRRDCSLNLEVIRNLKGKNKNGDDISRELQRYVLGLALISLTAIPPATLRQGCTLIPQIDSDNPHDPQSDSGKAWKPSIWRMFYADGRTLDWDPGSLEVKRTALDAANAFTSTVIPPTDTMLEFKPALLKVSIEADLKTKADKLAENAGDPVAVLRRLVEAVVIDPKKDQFKDTKPAKALRERLASILGDVKSSDELKSKATAIQAMLTTDTGAQARKSEMLALFPVSSSQQPAAVPGDFGSATTDGGPQ